MADEKRRARKEIMADIRKLAPERQRKVVEGAMLVLQTLRLERDIRGGEATPN